MFMKALFMIAQLWKQPKCLSTDEYIKKRSVYIMEYNLIVKKKRNKTLPFATTCGNLGGTMLRGIIPIKGNTI